MPWPKRLIPVSELKPGDSFRMESEPGATMLVRKIAPQTLRGEVVAFVVDVRGGGGPHPGYFIGMNKFVTVGHTNRKAKRLRAKMRRRVGLAEARTGDDSAAWEASEFEA